MKKISRRSFLQATGLMAASAVLGSSLTACGGSNASGSTSSSSNSGAEHPLITMNAPYRNMSLFYKLVHEKYPDINLEIIPYNGQNTSAYMKDMRLAGQVPDIYFVTYYVPGRYDDEDTFLDVAAYEFTDAFAQSRLREVTLNGGIYMLPLAYNPLGITYNKTLLDKNGWTLPTNLDELEELKEKVEATGCVFSRCQLEFPGYGFQYLGNIANTGFLSTVAGLQWQDDFLNGKANVSDTPEMVETLQLLNRWRDMGMLNGEGTPMDDAATKEFVAEGNTLFLVGNSNDLLTQIDTTDTFRLMPYLSADGKQNVFMLNVSRYVGLNKSLGEAGNEQKLEDALHIMEVLSTAEGIESLDPTQSKSRMLPLKNWKPSEESYYADVIDELNSGHTANYVYSGWENIVVVLGNKMIDFVCGNATLEEVIECFDENQSMITENELPIYTTVTENIGTEDCAKLVGIGLAQALDADAALISYNIWNYNPDDMYMNRFGVSGCLFPLPVTDEEIVSILPTGWRNNINTLTLTGARIKELAQTGFDYYGNGSPFPYVLVTKGGMELDDNTAYTIPICGATDEVAAEGGELQDSGVMGLEAMRTYLSQFETLTAKDIVWE